MLTDLAPSLSLISLSHCLTISLALSHTLSHTHTLSSTRTRSLTRSLSHPLSLTHSLSRRYGRDVAMLTDLVRCTVVAEDLREVRSLHLYLSLSRALSLSLSPSLPPSFLPLFLSLSLGLRAISSRQVEREIFLDKLLVRVHLIIKVSRPALRHGSLNSLSRVALYLPSWTGRGADDAAGCMVNPNLLTLNPALES